MTGTAGSDHLLGVTLPGLYGPFGIALLLTVDSVPLAWLIVTAALAGAVPALTHVDLQVGPGQMLALLGASGSGKTTLLHTPAGFIRPTAGEVRLGDVVVAGPSTWVAPEHREVGLVFQGAALWPHLSVLDTVAYPIRRRGRSRTEARQGAQILLEQVSLTALGDRLPAQLSGGEQ